VKGDQRVSPETIMKITHLSSAHPPDDNRIFKMCRSTAHAGRQVSFVVPTDRDSVVDGVAIKAVPLVSTRWKRMLFTTWRVYRRAVQERADIYQFHDPELIPVGLALRFLGKGEVIYDIHENVPDQILGKSYIPRGLRKLISVAYDRFERYCARKLSAIVTANEDINERFDQIGDRVIAVHNYADNDEFRDVLENEDLRYESGLIFHCAPCERTSFPAVLRAFELLSDQPGIKLVVTGCTASEARAAGQLIQQSGCQRIEVLGFLPRNELAKVYAQCAVSIVLYNEPHNHSSIRSNRFYESLGGAAPVIVPDFPEWRMVVESIGCGLTANPTDPQAIADALRYLLTHPREAAAMGRRGRRAFQKEFDWTRENDKLLQFYDVLVPANQPTAGIAVTTP
jgi:glycosyltransferase involved in cell wall biosynthesis